MTSLREKFLDSVILAHPKDAADFWRLQRKASKEHKLPLPNKTELRKRYDYLVRHKVIKSTPEMDRLLIRRYVRTMSGVAIITVLTKPFPCPGKCVYCPTEAIMPKSYLSNEPAAMRALLNKFDPHRQVMMRLRALTNNGHPTDKIELIVKGGTWSAYEWDYQQWFIKRCFDACNQFIKEDSRRKPRKAAKTLGEAQKVNEDAGQRIIGLTLETRPDWISPREIWRLRELGCTRIELGVQSTFDELLEITQRGHDVQSVRNAGRLLRNAGFKVDYHMMPQQPGTTPKKDFEDIKRLFEDPDFRPDMIKLYPTVVVPQAELYEWWKKGDYKPYSDKKLVETLIKIKSELIPPYCRISRLIRDIPSTDIVAGNPITNLREYLQKEMKERGLKCKCLRCREIGHADEKYKTRVPKLFDRKYDCSGGVEHFLSFEDSGKNAVFAFCRLRLPGESNEEDLKTQLKVPEIRGAAFLRELHTYGHFVPINTKKKSASQHKGMGKKLMARAEEIAKKAGFKKMAVISGVGVRGYYRKLGYRLQGTYMVKSL